MLSEPVVQSENDMLLVNGFARYTHRFDDHPAWKLLSSTCKILTASIVLKRFTALSLLELKHGQVVATEISASNDIHMSVGGVGLCTVEFEVVDLILAVRVNRVL